MKENKKKQIKIELKEEVAQGHYVNLPIVGFSQAEFILDFIKVIPGISKADVILPLTGISSAKEKPLFAQLQEPEVCLDPVDIP